MNVEEITEFISNIFEESKKKVLKLKEQNLLGSEEKAIQFASSVLSDNKKQIDKVALHSEK